LDWRRVNHQPRVWRNAKKLLKSFYGKKGSV
jgi:hypothetical protein